MPKIVYGADHEAVRHLSKCDPVMKEIIEGVGSVELSFSADHFASLVETIVGQMISMKAADAIYSRLLDRVSGEMTPETILDLGETSLKDVGLSGSKARAIHELAQRCITGDFDLAHLDSLPDEVVSEELVSLRGIGPWSAEMFMIFSLGRQDVFSAGDGGLTRAMKANYGIDVTDREALSQITEKWAPYRSVACLYLWKTLGNE